MSRTSKWLGAAALGLTLLLAVALALLAAHGLRAAIEQVAAQRTGRALALNGELTWKLDWPLLRVHALDVKYANPAWAQGAWMLAAPAIGLTVDLPRLVRGSLFLPDVALERPVVMFEQSADGRKNWLLDKEQRNESARALIGRVELDTGTVGYREPSANTSIDAEISSRRATPATAATAAVEPGIEFRATGRYAGLALAATGSGAPVIALRDEDTPYPVSIVAKIGSTTVRADGTITGLIKRSAADLALAVQGASLAELYPLLAMPLPDTHAYRLAGRLTHAAAQWRYENFSGRVGQSDVSGSLQLDSAGARPMLTGELAFKALNLDDMGPVVGADGAGAVAAPGLRGVKAARQASPRGVHALPEKAFRRNRWTSIDADVKVKALAIVRPKALPLEHLDARLVMRDSVLTLDPVDGGRTSKLLMEEIALHVPEIVLQKITGDRLIDIRCGVADFEVARGVMKVRTLVLDTDVTKVVGTGSVDLAAESLDVKLVARPKQLSLFALRGPVYVRGDFAHPDVMIDPTRAAVRGLAAAALAAINPALALIPMADPGTGKDSDCAALERRARAPAAAPRP